VVNMGPSKQRSVAIVSFVLPSAVITKQQGSKAVAETIANTRFAVFIINWDKTLHATGVNVRNAKINPNFSSVTWVTELIDTILRKNGNFLLLLKLRVVLNAVNCRN
jgi:hypothetical protein